MPVTFHPPRTAWGAFPDVVIHATESAVKQHPAYKAAKSGDDDAAADLVLDTFSLEKTHALEELVGAHQRWSVPTPLSAKASMQSLKFLQSCWGKCLAGLWIQALFRSMWWGIPAPRVSGAWPDKPNFKAR